VDIADVVREVAATLEPLVDGARVQVRVEVEPGLASLHTDRDMVKQILLNLVSNAIKYTDEGTIEVRATLDDTRARLRISDTGIGVAPDDVERIFDEFYRVDSRSAQPRSGTGLGLTISRRLARALGGDVTVESRLGAGSTFTLELPLGAQT